MSDLAAQVEGLIGPPVTLNYYVGMLLTLVWLVWTGITLLRRKA